MDAKSTGITISTLRKRLGLTQAALAEKLNVSDKTVSKWDGRHSFENAKKALKCPIFSILFKCLVVF